MDQPYPFEFEKMLEPPKEAIMKSALRLGLLLTLWFAGIGISAAQNTTPLRFGLLPDESANVVLQRFEPIRARLEKELNTPIKITLPSLEKKYSYQDLVDQFISGEVQIAYLGGLSFLEVSRQVPTVALAMRKKDTKFRSYFIAQSSNKIKSLKDIKGRSFAYGSKRSTSGHLMPRYFLDKEGIDSNRDFSGPALYSGAHDNTIAWVISGKADAGVVNSAVFDRHLQEGKIDSEKIEVFWVTPGYPDYIWVARKDVNPDILNQITRFFINLTPGIDEDEEILQALSASYYVEPSLSEFNNLKIIAEKLRFIKEKPTNEQ